MTIRSIVRYLTPAVTVILSVSTAVLASKESAQACFHAAEALNDIPSLNTPHSKLIEVYNSTCREEGLCIYDMDEELRAYVSGANNPDGLENAVSQVNNPAVISAGAKQFPIAMKASLDFGGSFLENPVLADYANACEELGGTIECIDAIAYLDGTISGLLAEGDGEQDGIVIDIEMFSKSFPYCLPPACEGEDLTRVLEDATRDALLKMPTIQANLNPTTESLMEEVTFAQMCALSGLPTCQLSVTTVDCQYSSSYGRTVGYVLSFVTALSSSILLFL